jgi:hypothetical protein
MLFCLLLSANSLHQRVDVLAQGAHGGVLAPTAETFAQARHSQPSCGLEAREY